MLHVPNDWEPMPRELREWYFTGKHSLVLMRNTRFVREVQDMIDSGEIEIEFRVKNHRYPDPNNRYWWRRRQADLFDGVAA
ncbi:MAG: hypothetical protein IAE63_00040 [Alphaproteobacteria bacterium]|nr:hypothetical protein [Alphaproteobacteria bacterium]